MKELAIYNYSTVTVDSVNCYVILSGVSLEDILNEYSTEDIVDALVADDKDADVIDELAKRSEEE